MKKFYYGKKQKKKKKIGFVNISEYHHRIMGLLALTKDYLDDAFI